MRGHAAVGRCPACRRRRAGKSGTIRDTGRRLRGRGRRARAYPGSSSEHREVARAGLEPDVEDVHLFPELRAAAVGALRSRGNRCRRLRACTRRRRLRARTARRPCGSPPGRLSGLPQPSHRNTAMGTPQMRWREMHQSGRVAIMFEMRSSPQAGSHFTLLDFVQRAPAQRVAARRHRRFHRDEPLLGGAEDDRDCGSASSADTSARVFSVVQQHAATSSADRQSAGSP